MPESDVKRPDRGWSSRRPPVVKLVVALLIGGLAFAITVQVRDDEGDNYSNVRGEQLVELLKSLDSANERLDTQIDDLTATRNGLLNSAKRSEEAQEQARLRAEQLSILAGTAGASGPGIELTVNDPDRQMDASQLLDAIEELRGAGAEVIVINRVVRVVAQTYFLDNDDAIRVGGRDLQRPYVIEAIGDPDDLAEAVRFPGGLIEGVKDIGGSVYVVKKDKITVTALADTKSPEYARPSS